MQAQAAQPFAISAESFRSKMDIPPQFKKMYDLAVEAGLKLLFSPQTRDSTLEYFESEEAMPQKIGQGIAAIMGLIYEQSNGTMPGQIIVPAGVELIGHCVDVARKMGLPADDADIAEGVAQFVQNILQQSGASPEQMQQLLGGMDSGLETPEV